MEELNSLDLLDSVSAAPPDPTGVAVAVRGDNVPWDCARGEHPSLGRGHHSLGDHLHEVHMPCEVSPPPSLPPVRHPIPESISRQRDKSTHDVFRGIFTYMSERAHGAVSAGEASWGYTCQGSNGTVAMDISALRG